MKAKQKIFIVFLLVSVIFVTGSFFRIQPLIIGGNFLLIPSLLLYYRIMASKWSIPIVVALFLFYIRDIFLMWGMSLYPNIIMISFLGGVLLFFLLVITSFQRSRIHPVEYFSLIIMYGFLGFITYTVADLVPEVIPSYRKETYLYLILLNLLLAISFTQYLIKSHYGSLWLMLAAASLLVSEISLFFKLYVIEDFSVNLFFPIFHVFTFYSLVQHGLHRRKTDWLQYF